jgi:hypothetical protein
MYRRKKALDLRWSGRTAWEALHIQRRGLQAPVRCKVRLEGVSVKVGEGTEEHLAAGRGVSSPPPAVEVAVGRTPTSHPIPSRTDPNGIWSWYISWWTDSGPEAGDGEGERADGRLVGGRLRGSGSRRMGGQPVVGRRRGSGSRGEGGRCWVSIAVRETVGWLGSNQKNLVSF